MSVTWSPTDKNANVTLSNGNLTATSNATGNQTDYPGRATAAVISGDARYGEIHIDTLDVGSEPGVGLADSTASLADGSYLGIDSHSICLFRSGSVWMNNGSIAHITGFSQGDTVSWATKNGQVWFRVNGGVWNGSAANDPATNTGGLTGPTGNLFPAYNVDFFSGVQTGVTANFGATSFTYTPPSGFSGLDSSSLSLSLTATEAPDTASFSASLLSLALAATEAPDTAAFTAALFDALALSASEAPDTAAFAATWLALALTSTEAPDLAAVAMVASGTSLALAASEAADVMRIDLMAWRTTAPDNSPWSPVAGDNSPWVPVAPSSVTWNDA